MKTAAQTYSVLGELQGTLVLADTQQLHRPLLIGSEADNLPDDITDELDTLVQLLQRKR